MGDFQSSPPNASRISHLLKALANPTYHMRYPALWILSEIGSPVVPHLLDALQSSDRGMAYGASETLRVMGAATSELIKLLHHEVRDVRGDAAKALGSSGNIEAIPALMEALEDRDVYIRSRAEEALSRIGESAMPILFETMRNASGYKSSGAAGALGKIGAPAVPQLLEMLEDESPKIQHGALWTLGQTRDIRAVPALLKALGHADEGMRSSAAYGLGSIGDPNTLDALLDTLNDIEARVRYAATETLRDMGDVRAVPNLIEMLHDADTEVRTSAALALAELGDPQAVPALIEKLADMEQSYESGEDCVCDAAAYALERIATPEALETVNRWRAEQNRPTY